MLSERSRQVDSSGIRRVFDLAATLKDPINFSIGQPHFDVPDCVKQAAIDAINGGRNRYTQTQGIPELREKALALDRARTGTPNDAVIITSGASGGIMLALMALLNPGDEVLIPDPYFVMYKHLTLLIGGVPKFVNTYPDFQLRAVEIEKLITPKSKVLFICTPANPTGAVTDGANLKDIADLAARHGLLVISDEIYHHFSYDAPPASIAGMYPGTLLLNGLSKSAAMTGWRLGWAIGPDELVKEMIKLQQYSFVCAPSMTQYGAMAALDFDVSGHIADYRRKRDRLCNALSAKYEIVKPGGAFYMFPKAPGCGGAEFAEKAVKNNLLVVPGNVFSQSDTHFRISYAASDATIERGIEVLLKIA
ncbi:MAG TPA: aminotransferase class I/II-fold pyridoxal phosphate-dependent enzyme [Candidatus Brocadiia bacterium]|nr:aminotransferase class I/II-fold pyridoxal phosphate-dependent enzyme [Candidatus Brocadiia bacterium]